MKTELEQDNFKFYVPDVDILEKAQKDDINSTAMLIKGIAAGNNKDEDGEFLDVNTMDLSDFKWINWNHKGKDDAAAVIGEPTVAKIIGGRQLYIEGELYPDVDMAKHAWNLMKSLKNSKRGNRLSFSVEGKVLERDPLNPSRITKSKVTAVALCPTPVNGSTWADLLHKGYTTDMIFSEDEQKTEKSYSVEKNIHVTKESVEGTENEEDKDDKNKKNNITNKKNVIKTLSKSEVYTKLFDYFYNQNNETADKDLIKSAFSLILKINTMNTSEENKGITQEDINKAFEILNLTKSSTAEKIDKKEEDGNDLFKMAKNMCKAYMDTDKEADGGKVTSHLMEKGYNKEMAEKAYGDCISEKETMKKSQEDDLSKGFNPDLLKSIIEGALSSSDEKFKQVSLLIKSQIDAQEKLVEVIEEQSTLLKSQTDFITAMQEKLDVIGNTKLDRKSMVKSYGERFETNEANKEAKVYDLKNPTHKKELIKKLNHESGLNKSVEGCDLELAGIASGLEIAGAVDAKGQERLNAMGIIVR